MLRKLCKYVYYIFYDTHAPCCFYSFCVYYNTLQLWFFSFQSRIQNLLQEGVQLYILLIRKNLLKIV